MEFCVTELYLFLCMKYSENVCSYICHCELSTSLSTKSSFQAVSVGYWLNLLGPLFA